MEFTSETARRRYDDLVAAARRSVIGLDFDGTLAPIVEDPGAAHIHPDAPELLVELGEVVGGLAVITGRPARQVLDLGGLEEVGAMLAEHGRELHVFGQYGHERWSSHQRRIISPRPPHGLSTFLRELPGLLRRVGAGEAYVEEKGLGAAVHTRRLPDGPEVFAALLPVVTERARELDLVVEPGRMVVEVRASGMDKGVAVRTLVEEVDAGGFCFCGDDLGDLEAFAAVRELGEAGMPTLLVCSASDEQSALAEQADLVVPGPDGIMAFLHDLRESIS